MSAVIAKRSVWTRLNSGLWTPITHYTFKVLINVGPAKPKHKLPESERKALLSESHEGEAANQSAGEHDETPQIEPYLETSFNTTEPLSAVSSTRWRHYVNTSVASVLAAR